MSSTRLERTVCIRMQAQLFLVRYSLLRNTFNFTQCKPQFLISKALSFSKEWLYRFVIPIPIPYRKLIDETVELPHVDVVLGAGFAGFFGFGSAAVIVFDANSIS